LGDFVIERAVTIVNSLRAPCPARGRSSGWPATSARTSRWVARR
jgi:hypothetical protein